MSKICEIEFYFAKETPKYLQNMLADNNAAVTPIKLFRFVI